MVSDDLFPPPPIRIRIRTQWGLASAIGSGIIDNGRLDPESFR
jgi:hypothetical protein